MDAGTLFAELNRLIGGAAAQDVPALVGRLVEAEERARLRLRSALASTAPEPTTDVLDRNLSAKEAARRLGVSLPYLYKHGAEYPFTVRIGKRVLFSARGLE